MSFRCRGSIHRTRKEPGRINPTPTSTGETPVVDSHFHGNDTGKAKIKLLPSYTVDF